MLPSLQSRSRRAPCLTPCTCCLSTPTHQVGKLGDAKPLPVFQSRVGDSGVIEVNV